MKHRQRLPLFKVDLHHKLARVWWEGAAKGWIPVGLPWVAMAGFILLMTHLRVLQHSIPGSIRYGGCRIGWSNRAFWCFSQDSISPASLSVVLNSWSPPEI